MPTYEYECEKCGLKFEQKQAITAAAITECPKCNGNVRRVITGGMGFILKGFGQQRTGHNKSECSLENRGKTCCGQNERCGKPPCGDQS